MWTVRRPDALLRKGERLSHLSGLASSISSKPSRCGNRIQENPEQKMRAPYSTISMRMAYFLEDFGGRLEAEFLHGFLISSLQSLRLSGRQSIFFTGSQIRTGYTVS